MNVTTSILVLLCTGLLMTGCRSSPDAKPDAAPGESSSQGDSAPHTPSKLEQADWQSAPPGMPEDKP